MKSLMRASALALILAVAAPAAAQAQSMTDHHAQVNSPTFNLSASGEVRLAPDMATITTGVQTEAATAQEAMAQNRARMNQVIAALRREGVEERYIQTSALNLNAVYDYPPNGGQPSLRGYQASNQVTIQVHDLDNLGQAIDAVVASGANQINGISFGLRDPRAAEDQARRAAVQALQARAQLYADATGMRLIGLRTLSETGGYQPMPPVMYARAESFDAAAGATPVQGGEVVVRIDISGVFDVSR